MQYKLIILNLPVGKFRVKWGKKKLYLGLGLGFFLFPCFWFVCDYTQILVRKCCLKKNNPFVEFEM